MRITVDVDALRRELARAREQQMDTRRAVWRVVQRVSAAMEVGVRARMPVRTGRARASWGRGDEGVWVEDEAGLSITQGSTVPYVGKLNDGSSRQTPAGFIDAEAARAADALADALTDIGT